MLRGSQPLILAQAETYYTREYARGDYYTRKAAGDTAQACWLGRGAAELGLQGTVDRDRFQALLNGRLADAQLVAPEAATGVHRAAWDFTVAPDMSVSLVALIGGDTRGVAAHLAAAEQAFAVLERHVQAKTARAGSKSPAIWSRLASITTPVVRWIRTCTPTRSFST